MLFKKNDIKGYISDDGLFPVSEASIAGMAIEAGIEKTPRKGREMSIYLQLSADKYSTEKIIPKTVERISFDCFRVEDVRGEIYYLRLM